eukprot:CAMPEP_0197620782 /NCGR_PEP_ID=MMETSP1338-20131121/1534_1 /TAXON_ID=43686 ORGANISM="Pelagodinium beii, Strain RCC1491" /NCGR_SAMPLE_ID=MMETSP1338 /ASSEMBLY_ACC=CAM_ASM_000754 /LENGTH=245 /DNA_ID=CAMNT_0043190057 /DNA_START=45 /DNA_END=782 /DNA_ORIENTATION=+
MSVQEFRGIFARETERYLSNCERIQREVSGVDPADELPNLPELRRLSNSMVDSIMQRFTKHAPMWGLHEDALNGRVAEVAQHESSRQDTQVARLESRCQELEAVLQQRREEEEQRKLQLLGRFKAECDSIMKEQEEELLRLRQASSFNPEAQGNSDVAENRHEQFSEQIQHLMKQLAESKDAVSKLEDVEKMEAQQRRTVPSIETLLASTMDEDRDEEEEEAAAMISKGEQVCKRLRRHLGSSGD